MGEGFFRTKSGRITLATILVPLLMLVAAAVLFMRPEPMKAEAIFGCYTAPRAPSLLIGSDGIHIIDGTGRKFDYTIDYLRSYVITVKPAWQLSPVGNGTYVFKLKRGVGYSWPLLASRSKGVERVQRPDQYAGRMILIAADSTEFIYNRPKTQAPCR